MVLFTDRIWNIPYMRARLLAVNNAKDIIIIHTLRWCSLTLCVSCRNRGRYNIVLIEQMTAHDCNDVSVEYNIPLPSVSPLHLIPIAMYGPHEPSMRQYTFQRSSKMGICAFSSMYHLSATASHIQT